MMEKFPEWFLQAAAISGGIVTIVGLLVFLWKVWRKLATLSEGIMGKPAVTDYAGETVSAAVPSLQARVGKIEELLINQADTNKRLTDLETWRVEHEQFSQDLVNRLLTINENQSRVAHTDTIE